MVVAKHMAVATLWRAVRLAEIGDFEESAISALPVGDKRFGQAVPGPEEVIRIRLETGRNRAQEIGDVRRERHKNRNAGLGLVEE